jgi:DNA repair exonuclease SbcCD ATPase subunit
MSELKDKLTEKVNKINDTITNESERLLVLDSVKDIVEIFTEQVIRLSQKHDELEEKTGEIYEMLTQIEEELIGNFGEEMEADCPYCGEKIQLKFQNNESTDFECPKCHNVIEMELMTDNDEHECGCGNCHGECSGCSEEDDEEEDDK